MKQRFGCVNYLNSLPYSIPLSTKQEISLICDVPTTLFTLFSQNKLDVVITSSSHSFLSNQNNFIPFLGIGANHSILSVNLYASDSFFQQKNPVINVTNESSSSVLLLKILCKFYWSLIPTFITAPSNPETISKNCDGFLLIGNDALFSPKFKNFHTYDLAKEWFNFSQSPFVFALCYMQKEKAYDNNVEKILREALVWSNINKNIILETAKKLSGMDKKILQKYFQLCIYSLSEKHLEGLNKFQYFYEKL